MYNLENGIFAYSGDTHKITMSGSAQIYGNDWCGINTENVQNVTVTMSGNAQIYGNNSRGVLLDATPNGNFTMDGNAQIYGNGQGGVKCSSSHDTFAN